MAKFRKKPVVIEAVQYDEDKHHLGLIDFGLCWNGVHNGIMVETPYIITLEGRMHVSDGDWIIKGVDGEFYPCKPDIFEKTYEPAE